MPPVIVNNYFLLRGFFISLITALHQIGAIKFGEFTLKSGETSKIYLDLRQIIAYPTLLRTIADTIWHQLKNHSFDLICGVPYTALPIATAISLQHNVPMVMRRKEKKTYGTKQQVEGRYQPAQNCLVIEDVITTGGSILETIHDLTAADIRVRDAIVLIDREQSGVANLKEQGVHVHAVFSLQKILQELLVSKQLTDYERNIVDELCHAL